MSPGKPPDKAASPRCHAQEGDPVGDICVRDSCSCPEAASGHPQASGSRSPDCPRCQASHERKSMGSLSPQPLPQCKRHMKQVQLLFCEDHRAPICLICSLSQEHRGHRVRPIEEAALEHKVGTPCLWALLCQALGHTGPCFIFPTTPGCWCISQHSWAGNGKNTI